MDTASLDSEVHVISVCGPVREENQDAGVAWRDKEALGIIVADGMGGHQGGREAAEIVIRICLDALRTRTFESWEEKFREAIAAAQEAVLEAAGHSAENGRSLMGATVALAVVDELGGNPRLHIAHVGDSRVYLFRGRSLYRLTSDHSAVAQMVRDGWLSEEEAFGHPDSNIVQRAIGQKGPLEAEVQEPLALDPEDVVMLCSDGLHGAVPDPVIGDLLALSGSAEEACQRLLAQALEANSQDNITIGCAKVVAERTSRRPTRVLL